MKNATLNSNYFQSLTNNSFASSQNFGWLGKSDLINSQNEPIHSLACSCLACSNSTSIGSNSDSFINNQATVPLSNDPQINALLDGSKWDGNTITYSFFSGGSYYGDEIGTAPVSDRIKANLRYIIEDIIEPLVNVNFVEVADTSNSYGQIRYLNCDVPTLP